MKVNLADRDKIANADAGADDEGDGSIIGKDNNEKIAC